MQVRKYIYKAITVKLADLPVTVPPLTGPQFSPSKTGFSV